MKRNRQRSIDAASFNRFTAAFVYYVLGSSLSSAFDTDIDASSFSGSYVLLMALAGLFLGVKMPTLTWTNEIMPMKQGGPVVLTVFGGFGYMVLLFVGFMLLPGWMLGFCGYVGCFVGANLFLTVWIWKWLHKKELPVFQLCNGEITVYGRTMKKHKK